MLQVMSDPAGGMTFVADPKKPVGGHVMAHASTQRIYMRKGKAEQRVAKVIAAWLLQPVLHRGSVVLTGGQSHSCAVPSQTAAADCLTAMHDAQMLSGLNCWEAVQACYLLHGKALMVSDCTCKL